MQIMIKTFAQTRELSQVPVLALSMPQGSTIAEVKTHLRSLNEKWSLALEGSILTARNHQLCDEKETLQENDEIAFFPPVTGG
ncbi:molybdopterin synthase sulfur carrier subunit [Alteromonas sp. 345S023]|uniref:Molybdopterin synthase sulfur carrier subunit n=1 Tax=Alteromonas profundi TaxID=2696062 RepID=A0A7X5LJV5_9ALTE|nr:MoaD/ThiS family protein [Alteromonas profundi]NDV90668.1 molybdopterin synthase sulfur carrier subunit [Alteromonas profundi]